MITDERHVKYGSRVISIEAPQMPIPIYAEISPHMKNDMKFEIGIRKIYSTIRISLNVID